MTIDLDVCGVSKRYWIHRTDAARAAETGLDRVRSWFVPARDPHWALRDVTFQVETGDAVGIVGPNGAGKSTLFKLLSAITAPTAGEIRIHGRLAALIELGSGFHPELTGRENVFLSGSLLGMKRAEIAAKLESIVEFAGIGAFIDSPVKWYSSGMHLRLGFAVAAHLDAEIVLIDEVLAVGDEAFQQKCLTRIAELRRGGTTVLFVSHDLATVAHVCRRALLIDGGRIQMDGPAAEVVGAYRRSAASLQADAPVGRAAPLVITRVACQRPADGPIRTGASLRLQLSFAATRPLEDVIFEISCCTHGGNVLHCQLTTAFGAAPLAVPAGPGVVEFECDELGLQPQAYSITVRAMTAAGDVLHTYESPERLVVSPGRMVAGYFYQPHTWRMVGRDTQRLRRFGH